MISTYERIRLPESVHHLLQEPFYKGEEPTIQIKIKMFLEKIEDDDYNVVKQNLQYRTHASFE
jgi:hypothetical protein